MIDLSNFFTNFLQSLGNYVPGVLGALLVLLIGWLIASSLGKLAGRLVYNSGIDKKIGGTISKEKLAVPVHKLVYSLLMVLVLMVVLEILGVQNVLQPLKDMVSEFMGYLPNIVGAGVIGFVGYTIATIVSELVGMASNGIENFALRMGLHNKFDMTKLAKQLAFIFIFIPILISALDVLQINAISDPAKDMLSTFINSIPNILAATVVMIVTIIGGRYVTQLLSQLLRNLDADSLRERLSLQSVMRPNMLISNVAPNIVYFFLLFLGAIAAMNKLGFSDIAVLLQDLLNMSGRIFFGLIILVFGNSIAGMAYDAVAQSKSGTFVASIARYAILGLFIAIAFRSMGVANEIVELAFGLTLGALAVAFALAFGLGGREAAGKQMEYFLAKFREEK